MIRPQLKNNNYKLHCSIRLYYLVFKDTILPDVNGFYKTGSDKQIQKNPYF